jgi:4-alpha-glucanotransferase
MGDLPIYVAHDSADVWSHPEMFLLNEDGSAKSVAGVPPDYFSATGQLWGNPIYDWQKHRDTGFVWWIERVRASLQQFDLIRVDHFRGFEAYWEVPGGDKTAENGKWVKAPGRELFTALQQALGPLPVLAENLGVITAEVEGLRTSFDLPGMAILQFAFGADPQAPYFKPHNYTHDRVAYTGTHDNDTVMGWWNRREATATESAEDIAEQHENARRYLRTDCEGGEEVNWAFIRALMASVASAVVFPMQDVLGLGTEARMNYPGTASGNWRWRMRNGQMREVDAARLRALSEIYDR